MAQVLYLNYHYDYDYDYDCDHDYDYDYDVRYDNYQKLLKLFSSIISDVMVVSNHLIIITFT